MKLALISIKTLTFVLIVPTAAHCLRGDGLLLNEFHKPLAFGALGKHMGESLIDYFKKIQTAI